MSNINAGIVVVTEFCDSGDEAFSGYIDYIDREEAIRQSNFSKFNIVDEFSGYLNYMGNEVKSTGLFTKDNDTLNQIQKKKLKEVFELSQKNESLMWQTVISFDNIYISELGIYDSETNRLSEKELKAAARKAIDKMLENEGLQNAVWSASIHYNTDNIHIHIATVEPSPTREKKMYKQYEKIRKDGKLQYKLRTNEKTGKKEKIPILDNKGKHIEKEEYRGKFKLKSLRKCKSILRMELDQNKEVNKNISMLMRDRIIGSMNKSDLMLDDDFKETLQKLYKELPRNVNRNLWKYNGNVMKPYKDRIDDISRMYIEKYHKEDFQSLEMELEGQETEYAKSYGGSNNYKENKINDLYARLGNAVLNELRQYDKTNSNNIFNVPEEVDAIEYNDSENDLVMPLDEIPDFTENISEGYFEWNKDYKQAKRLMLSEHKYEEARDLLLQEALKGNALAIYDLGDIYKFGRGVDINTDIARTYYERALRIFEKEIVNANEFGKNFLSYRIGKMYYYGLGTEENCSEAADWFQAAADNDNPYAQYVLGNLYLEGDGVKKNINKAINLYEKAARKNPYAAYKLGTLYSKGEVVELDTKLADNYYAQAFTSFNSIEEPDENLKYRLGYMYLKGFGTKVNIDKSKEFLKDAADLGHPYAAYTLAKIYLEENTSEEMIDNAIKLLEQAAYKGKNSIAKYALGKFYADDEHSRKDIEKAVTLLKEAVDEGNDNALYTLGKIYQEEESAYYDINEAIKYFTEAGKKGNEFAQFRLGKIYMQENTFDEDKAVFWFEKAAEHDNMHAQYNLGRILTNPQSKNFNMEKGIEYLRTVAEKGNEFAQFRLGKIYMQEDSFNEEQAIFWLKKAAEHGNLYARYNLGTIFTNFESKNFNAEKGIEYLKNVAEQKNEFAELKLGLIYLKGEIVPQNIKEAQVWLKRSYENGNDFAGEVLKNIGKNQLQKHLGSVKEVNNFISSIFNRDYGIDNAIRFLRKSMQRQYEEWKNLQEFEELQNKIAKVYEEEDEM